MKVSAGFHESCHSKTSLHLTRATVTVSMEYDAAA